MTPSSASWPLGPSPNLLRDPWIPVRDLDGDVTMIGLRDLLGQASQLAEIATGHGPTDAALTILACAIVGSADIAKNVKERRAILTAGRLPDVVDAYLKKWEAKFDLASPHGGFLQAVADQVTGVKRGNPGRTLFADTNVDDDFKMYRPPSHRRISWHEAARALVERNLFDLGGPVSSWIPPAPSKDGSHGIGGVAATTMIVYAVGQNFLETLILNAPKRDAGDAPSWEEPPTVGIRTERRSGPLRSMTARARTTLLEYDDAGNVNAIVFGAGTSFEGPQVLQSARFVLAYINPKGEVRYPKMDIGRGTWGACHMAFLTNEASKARLTLIENAKMYTDDDRAVIPLRFVGYATNKKLVEFVHLEEFIIPRSLMADPTGSHAALLSVADYARKAINAGVSVLREATLNAPSKFKASHASEDFKARCYEIVARRFQDLVDSISDVVGDKRQERVRTWARNVIAEIGSEVAEVLLTLDDARKYAEGMNTYPLFAMHDDLFSPKERAERAERKIKRVQKETIKKA